MKRVKTDDFTFKIHLSEKQEDCFLSPILFSTANLPDNTLGIMSMEIKRQDKNLSTSLSISNVCESKRYYADTEFYSKKRFLEIWLLYCLRAIA